MKMHYIETEGYPEWDRDCLCRDIYGEYVVASITVSKNGHLYWDYTEELVHPEDIAAWIYIDELNLEV